jgi:hypothetical protein
LMTERHDFQADLESLWMAMAEKVKDGREELKHID